MDLRPPYRRRHQPPRLLKTLTPNIPLFCSSSACTRKPGTHKRPLLTVEWKKEGRNWVLVIEAKCADCGAVAVKRVIHPFADYLLSDEFAPAQSSGG